MSFSSLEGSLTKAKRPRGAPGWLREAWDPGSLGGECQPHAGRGDHFKTKIFPQNKTKQNQSGPRTDVHRVQNRPKVPNTLTLAEGLGVSMPTSTVGTRGYFSVTRVVPCRRAKVRRLSLLATPLHSRDT